MRGRFRSALLVGGTTAASFAALAAWRLFYYGWPLPNTYYAKVAGPLPERIAGALPLLSRVVVLERREAARTQTSLPPLELSDERPGSAYRSGS